MAGSAREAVRRLRKEDLAAVAVNARFVKPLDPRLPKWASAASLVTSVEDNVESGGLGSAVAECLARAGVTTPVRILGIPDRFVAHGNVEEIHTELGLDSEGIVAAVLEASANLRRR